MFFKLHQEGKIGYKKLSEADLGLGTSHQTHIGLFGDIFTFLSDREVEEEAFLIYNDTIDIVDCYFDRIENPDGTFRSPKIRKGLKHSVSVVTIIRDKVQEEPNKDWYLIWFGLENKTMVFYFFNNDSIDYQEVSNIFNLSKRGRIEKENAHFQVILKYLENKIDVNGRSILQDLEIVSQTEIPVKKYKEFDLEKASQLFKKTGELGEQLVANYLDHLKSEKQIFNFTWYNKSRETGLPYDFTIQDNSQNIIYVDAKSTNYQFEQPMIFSSQELEFIKNTPNYSIYRVFDIGNQIPKFKICEQSKNLANQIVPHIKDFDSKLKLQDIKLRSAKLAIKPINNLLMFDEKEIKLNF